MVLLTNRLAQQNQFAYHTIGGAGFETDELTFPQTKGFVYAVTITGITGGDAGLPADLADYLEKVASYSSIPVCAGFGIRSAADVAAIGSHASGAIVGSALVEVLEEKGDPKAFLSALLG